MQFNREKTVFLTNGDRGTRYPYQKKKKNGEGNLALNLTPWFYIKTDNELNVKHKFIKLLEKNKGENLE